MSQKSSVGPLTGFYILNRAKLKAFKKFIGKLESETLELLSLTKPNRIKHGFAESEFYNIFMFFRTNRTLFYCI